MVYLPFQQILWRVEQLDLSHNQLENVQNLQWLSNLTQLDLSHNRLRRLDSLHTKLGNVTSLSLAGNMIETLQGESVWLHSYASVGNYEGVC